MQISKAQTNDTETVISGLRSPRGIAVDPVNEYVRITQCCELNILIIYCVQVALLDRNW